VDAALLLLADGRFPSGGHAYSAGVESAVAYGDVVDIETLDRYLAGRLATTGVVDAAFACRSCAGFVDELDREYDARLPSPRTRDVSKQLARQLLRAASRVWPIATPWPTHHANALGVVVQAAGGTPADAVSITIHQLATAVTTAAVRLLGLDPLAVAVVHAKAVSRWDHAHIAEWSQSAPSELPASSGTLSEILAQHHGTWSHRLFVA
jgi:urease accessory protein